MEGRLRPAGGRNRLIPPRVTGSHGRQAGEAAGRLTLAVGTIGALTPAVVRRSNRPHALARAGRGDPGGDRRRRDPRGDDVPAAAADRLAGVSVAIASFAVDDLAGGHRLRLSVRVVSSRDVDECIGFALDEPFAARRIAPDAGGCVRPRAGAAIVGLHFDGLTADDLAFPAHTLVWGIPGGRCGIVLEAFGVCVVDQAGTSEVQLPAPPGLPSFAPIGTFAPLFSFPVP